MNDRPESESIAAQLLTTNSGMDVEPEIEAAQDGKTREIVTDNVDSEPLGIRREDTSDRLAIFKVEKEELEASLARELTQTLQLKQEVAEAETRNAELTKVPALQRYMRSRGQLQQPAGVQITSSIIYTSTLHIARLNVRNTGIANDELEVGPGTHSRPDHTAPDLVEAMDGTGIQQQSARGGQDTIGNGLQPPIMNPQHTETAHSFSFLNPFGSLLLWLLGGASADGIVSFLSMFRDVRDQGQIYQEPTRDENEPAT